jgi:hypothetical protein
LALCCVRIVMPSRLRTNTPYPVCGSTRVLRRALPALLLVNCGMTARGGKKPLKVCFEVFFSLIHFPVVPICNIGPLSGFLWSHIQLDSSGWVISPSQRPLPTQENTTYEHNRQTSMPWVGFEPAILATKRPQTYSLDRAATGIGVLNYNSYKFSRRVSNLQQPEYKIETSLKSRHPVFLCHSQSKLLSSHPLRYV